MFAEAVILLDERMLFDWSVYTFVRDLALRLDSSPFAAVHIRWHRISFGWEPTNFKLELPTGKMGVATLKVNWGESGSVEDAALQVICTVAPIFRNWQAGDEKLGFDGT